MSRLPASPTDCASALLQDADAVLPGAAETAGGDAPRATLRLVGHRVAWIAAAASFLLALLGWWPRLGSDEPASIDTAAAVATAAWAPGPDGLGRGVTGEVVWSNPEQRGEMRFKGLAVNDPQRFQYQLWIFDRQQDIATPIDGGVFDVKTDGSVVIPIQAKLPVAEPFQFAVTVEKPGGVVVSSRERLILLAKL